jgi:hypothetical protein
VRVDRLISTTARVGQRGIVFIARPANFLMSNSPSTRAAFACPVGRNAQQQVLGPQPRVR